MLFACSGFEGYDEGFYKHNNHNHNGGHNTPTTRIPPAVIDSSDVNYWVGTGSNIAILVVQWNDDIEPEGLIWGYRWNPAETKYGINMILDIARIDPRFYALLYDTDGAIDNNGNLLGVAVGGLGYDRGDGIFRLIFNDSIPPAHDVILSPNAKGLFITKSYNFDNYRKLDLGDRWQSGWYTKGYWSYWVSDNLGEDVKWEYSNWGASTRELKNHSIDAWYFDTHMNDPDSSTYYRCMQMGDDCDGRDFFGDLSPVTPPYSRSRR